ncbi:type II toxin-antitoxin system VapC family toxin [Noviherbaspirillum malthae]|jgi:predicted nucleic acid-binding protein|uniref:type II toxin-antitoxin system VapC family toxin n=1 Tax=Noviherbaspirillum malthae TaxID=1260987 RepID=UPI00188ED94B|nr:PIN domain-containing protein [Noviherbaspirillum malthae]
MNVLFDSSVLIDLFNENLKGDHRAKIDDLIASIKRSKKKILVPTPTLTELMVHAGPAREKYYEFLSKSTTFQITPFDGRAAMDCALMLNQAFSKPEQKKVTRTKFKFDWQIAAIAASRDAEIIYSEDSDLERCATRIGIAFLRPSELPLPESARQKSLPLSETAEESK